MMSDGVNVSNGFREELIVCTDGATPGGDVCGGNLELTAEC